MYNPFYSGHIVPPLTKEQEEQSPRGLYKRLTALEGNRCPICDNPLVDEDTRYCSKCGEFV